MTDLPPPPASPPEEAAPASASGRGARLAIAAVAVAVVVALVAGVVVVTSDDGDDPPARTERAADDERPAEAEDEEDPGALEGAVAELSRFVEQERGRPFLRPVEVELLADDEFVERLRDRETDEEEVAESERLFRAIGLLGPDDDLQAAIDQVVEGGVVGFYDPETDALVVRGAELSPSVRSTLVHELTHAWDDQHFELHRPQLHEAEDESGFGFSALVEGNAERVEDAWLSQLSSDERREARESEAGEPSGLDEIPDVVLQLVALPYQAGPVLLAALLAAGDEARVDAAFGAPPTTSEQVLEPATYVNGPQPAVAVPDPPADGEVDDQGVFGTAGVFVTLADGVSPEDANRAAAGWGGDRYVTWADGDRACMRLAVVGDTPADTRELRDAWTAWAEEQDDAGVEDVEGRVVVTSCA